MKKFCIILIITLTTAISSYCQSTFYDYSFGDNGFSGKSFDSESAAVTACLQPDGKMLILGIYYPNFVLVRFNANGSIDNSFGNQGVLILEGLSIIDASGDHLGVKTDINGYIYIMTMCNNGNTNNVMKLDSDGQLVASFGVNGIATIETGCPFYSGELLLQDDGKIVLVGYSDVEAYSTLLCRLNADGTIDENFGGDGFAYTSFIEPPITSTSFVYSAAIQSNGNIIAGGNTYYSAWMSTKVAIAAFNQQGQLDFNFGNNGKIFWALDWYYAFEVLDVEVDQLDRVIVAGFCAEIGNGLNKNFIVRFNADGSLDETFNNVGYIIFDATSESYFPKIKRIQGSNDLIMTSIVGETSSSAYNYKIMKIMENGQPDYSFGDFGIVELNPDTAFHACDMALQNDGKIVIAATALFDEIGYDSGFGVIRLAPNSNLHGKVYCDDDQNGVMNGIEPGLKQKIVKIEPGPTYISTLNEGDFYYANQPGFYSVSIVVPPYWVQSSVPELFETEISEPNQYISDLNFGIYPRVNITDLATNVTGIATRAGFETQYWVNYSNFGTNTQSGILSFEYDNKLSFVSSDIPPTSHVGNLLQWEYNGLGSLESRQIIAVFQVPGVEFMGDSLISSCTITPYLNDTLLLNNYDTIQQVITGSYDPNDKQVEPSGVGNSGLVLFETCLEYTIRFQNTGTDTAFNVMVVDTLSDALDVESFSLLASSSPCEFYIRNSDNGKSVLIFKFNNIRLPHQSVDELGSNGFVKFSINPLAQLNEHTEVLNDANIYFDYNPPIVTNTVINTYVSAITSSKLFETKVLVYPNPTTGIIRVDSDNVLGISVIGLDGKNIMTKKSSNEVDLSSLPKGIYFLKIELSTGIMVVKISLI